jgi:hypothetical protein
MMAESTKKIAPSEETADRSGHEALIAGSSKKTPKSKRAAEPPAHDDLLDENRDNLKAFVEANEAIMNGMAALNAEMLAFGNKRFCENLDRSESLVGCNDAEQAFRVQCEFFQSATQQYLDQTGNVLAIMAKITADFWAPLQQQTSEALRDLNEETR